MKKMVLFLILIFSLHAQNLYFQAFQDINKAKRIQKENPEKANQLYIEAYTYLKQLNNKYIKSNKPSANVMYLLGNLYLNGLGIEMDKTKGAKLLCKSAELGNLRAKKEITKLQIKCEKINLKELKQ